MYTKSMRVRDLPLNSGVGEAPRPTLAVRPYLNKTNAPSNALAIFKVHRG